MTKLLIWYTQNTGVIQINEGIDNIHMHVSEKRLK